jgi:superfamily II DNA helicase RecQ
LNAAPQDYAGLGGLAFCCRCWERRSPVPKKRVSAVRRAIFFDMLIYEKKAVMALLTQFTSFFISPFGEKSVSDELNGFLKSHRIVNVEKRLIDGERGTGWVFLVEYGTETKAPQNTTQQQPRVDYREVLNEVEYAIFDKLRTIRKELSEKQGIPVYAVFSNEQLASMVKKQPKTAKELQSIAGIGEARVKQYGEAFIYFFKTEEAASSHEKSE